MKTTYFLKVTLSLSFFLIMSLTAEAQDNKVDAFIDQLISKPYSFNDDLDAKEYFFSLSKQDLRLVRNAIFAQYGYIFKSEDLRDYFKNKKWYKPTIADLSRIPLSETDNTNIKFLEDLESDPSFQDFLKLFGKGTLPIRIDTAYAERARTNELQPRHLIKFFGIKKPVSIHYAPQYLISRNANFIVFLYKEELAAGGGMDFFNLATFSPDGRFISKLIVARFGGDLDQKIMSNTVIDKDLKIHVEDLELSGDSDESAGGGEKVIENETYVILRNGTFEKLSANQRRSTQ